jgi:hypothetical protein
MVGMALCFSHNQEVQKRQKQLTNSDSHFIELALFGTPLWSLVNYHTRNAYLCTETTLWADAVTSRFSFPTGFARESGLLPEAS